MSLDYVTVEDCIFVASPYAYVLFPHAGSVVIENCLTWFDWRLEWFAGWADFEVEAAQTNFYI